MLSLGVNPEYPGDDACCPSYQWQTSAARSSRWPVQQFECILLANRLSKLNFISNKPFKKKLTFLLQ